MGESLLRRLQWIELDAAEIMSALNETDAAGVRGGASYDFLHLAAARKVRAARLHTLNGRHFKAFARHGDPIISEP